jgi:hypothetical protein
MFLYGPRWQGSTGLFQGFAATLYFRAKYLSAILSPVVFIYPFPKI